MWLERTGERNLCLAGGTFLNCKSNQSIADLPGVDAMFVQPASGDDGTALGAAWHVARGEGGGLAPVTGAFDPYLGPRYDPDEVRAALEARPDLRWTHVGETAEYFAGAAADIAADRIVAWFSGRMEFGPRALGNRSILARPDGDRIKERINGAVKFREAFRPFAPAVLDEDVDRLFVTRGFEPDRYMLCTAQVRPEARTVVEGIVHADDSARIQTVRDDLAPGFARLLREVKARTGAGVVVNTSFNVKGQPLIMDPGTALDTFAGIALDRLYIEGYVVEGTPPHRMSAIRPLTREDLPAVASLYERVARSGGATPPAPLAGYLERLCLDAVWADPEIPPLVAEGGDGAIIGFLGSYPRRVRLDGRALRVGCSGHLVAEPSNPGIGALLTRTYMQGPQDLTITDGATDYMRQIWRTLRGRVRTAPSFGWYRVLRPTSTVASLLGDRGRPVPGPLRSVGGGLDALARRIPRIGARPAPAPDPDVTAETLTVEALLEQTSSAPRHWRLHPDYDERYLTGLFAELDAVVPVRGEVLRRLVRGRNGRVLGWYVAFVPAGGIAQVQQLAATGPDPGPVLDHLIAEADARGAAAVAGRLEPSLADAVRRRRCVIRSSAWALVDSDDTGVLAALDADDTLLTRLDGEWWMGHHLLWREREAA